ncbi:hypothetical protein WJX73_008459 [Symbiochloris irregularis]|uniref:Glycosyltransferase family 92 protein n=1 Tax=Symbiochloris irregularis TaxID=706552 RepID=A0AAW1NHT3_9CHLO
MPLTITGQDPELDGWQPHPENIILRFFLASQDLGNGSVLVRGPLQRDSLDRRPEFGKLGNPVHVFLGINHKWNPEISLTPIGGGQSYPLLFQEQIPLVANWTILCPPPDGIDVNHNLSPFFVQAIVPSALINRTLELRIQGWPHYALYTIKPQLRSSGPRQSWSVLSLPIAAEDARMQGFLDSVAVHTKYHLRIGFTGTFIFVRAEHVAALLQYPATKRFVASGRIKLVMWEGLFGCQGYPRCYGDNRIGDNDKAYQPLAYTIAAQFLWKDNAFIYYTDPDEFLLINRPGMTVADIISHPECGTNNSIVEIPRFELFPDYKHAESTGHAAHIHSWHAGTQNKHDLGQLLSIFTHRLSEQASMKQIVLDDLLIGSHVHGSYSFLNTRPTFVPASCALQGHVFNLHKFRSSPERLPLHPQWGYLFTETRDWLWALQP